MEWIRIDPNGEFEAKGHDIFLLMDKWGLIYTGFTARDYYEAEYWFPVPKIPACD